jgi:LPPG:FO 2-phospho-L-lactate transferase
VAVTADHVVALVGGVGGAKLAFGLARVLPPEALTIIVNTGDDFRHYGLHISPDLDTVTYTLSGLVDPVNGWGIRGDTTAMLEAMRRLGDEPWFRLGDQDLATHLYRTQALAEGQKLTAITRRITASLGILHAILPMTDAPVATIVDTLEFGELPFQTYFVRHRWQPTLRGLRFEGAEKAELTHEVESAIRQADVILIAPSNPWLSIAPMLAVTGMRRALLSRQVPRVAVSPIVAGQAVKGPAAKLMAELGFRVSPATVADFYGEIINGFVTDVQDQDLPVQTAHRWTANTIMMSERDRVVFAEGLLDWIMQEDWA